MRTIDAPYHQYQMEVARDLCREGQVSGYEPRFLAGAIGGVALNASAKVPAAVYCVLGHRVTAASVYKHFSFWSGVFAPALTVLACALLGASTLITVLAWLFGWLLWWAGPLRWYHTAGMVSWVFAAYMLPAFVVAYVRWGLNFRPSIWVTLGIVGAFGFLLHPLFAVAAVILGTPVLIASWQLQKTKWLAGSLAVVGALTVIPNLIWVIPTATAPGMASAETPYQRAVDPLLPFHEILGNAATAAGGSKLYGVLALGTLLLTIRFRNAERLRVWPIVFGAALLMAWAGLAGASSGLALMQPNRFSALAWLVLCIPAAAGLTHTLRHALGPGTERFRVAWALPVVAGMLLTTYYIKGALQEALSPPGQPRVGAQPPEARSAGPLESALSDFLQQSTSAEARVLFENSLGRIHDGGHWAGLLAYSTHREFIGGPYPFVGAVSAWDETFLGQKISALSVEELERLLDAYNIGWVLCHSTACKEATARLPATVTTEKFGQITAFRREHYPGFVAVGTAKVTGRCTNRVEVSNEGGGLVVLRYHWVPGLRSVPSGDVSPIVLNPSLAPFVEVRNAPAQFALRTGEGDGTACR